MNFDYEIFLKTATVDVLIMVALFYILDKIQIILLITYGSQPNVFDSIISVIIVYILTQKIRSWINIR